MQSMNSFSVTEAAISPKQNMFQYAFSFFRINSMLFIAALQVDIRAPDVRALQYQLTLDHLPDVPALEYKFTL